MEALYAALAALVALGLAVAMLRHWAEARGLHHALWGVGFFLFGAAMGLEAWAKAADAWSEAAYWVWYFAGAMHGVTFLGLGSLALVSPPAARGGLYLLAPLILAGAYLVATAPVALARLPAPDAPSGRAFPPIHEAGLATPRAWTIPFNLLGTGLLLGVAVASTLRFWRTARLRALGTLVIAAGALELAAVSALNRFGVVGLEEAGRMLGVLALYAGVRLADRAAGER